ncbi:pentatricopeptide repeat-containing protein At5g27270 isoform X2 [Andrographis paniculata]|uniref:pentatricopeptide repeat-containing protein At5g27270 isoform X2 n=1 Tax=Andrographis paniculata TaxID=175694 RepID=UPI0021E789D2|nr:pentatricopeptide repeat-containing protein At5g27270 isoform X2 [Andrographis paniculata]
MESLKSSFLHPSLLKPPSKVHKRGKPPSPTVLCCLKPDPWSLSSGNSKDLNKPKPKSKHPKNVLSDDNARRIIKAKARYLSVLRRNQGSLVQTPRWIKRTPEQMVQYLEDDRNGHLYGRHVVAAIKCVRSTSGMREGSYNMREVMSSFVAKLSFREMCVVLKELKNWRQVRDMFAWMKLQLCYRPSVIVYTIVLRALGQAGKIKLSEEIFLEMLEAGCEPDEVACGTMLCSYAKWGRPKKNLLHSDVIYVWRQMVGKGVAPNEFTYTVVISSLVKGGKTEEAFRTFNEMKNFGFVPEESTYSLLIGVYSKDGDKTRALCLYEDMRSRRIVPSNYTCASLLALYYRTADYSSAFSLFTEMELYGVVADEVIYGLLIRIYGKLGLYEDAQRTFSEIERSGQLTREKTYTTMAQVHLNYGNFDKALDVMEKMKSKSIPFSRFSNIVLLQSYILKMDLASAEITYQALSKTGVPDPTSCKYMLNLYLTHGFSEKATSFVDQIKKDGIEFDEELFMIAMRVYCRGGMLQNAEQLIEGLSTKEMFRNFPPFKAFHMAMNGQYNTSAEYESFLGTLGQGGEIAMELMITLCLAARNEVSVQLKLELLLQTKVGMTVGNQMITKSAKEGDLLSTEYLYRLMIKLRCRIEDAAGASLIGAYAKVNKVKQAEEVFAAVAGCATDENAVYGSMIESYITCGMEEEAYMFYTEQEVKGHTWDPVSISILVKALVGCGKYSEAREIILHSFRKNLKLDTVAYNTFIKAMLDAGKLHFAISVYKRMVSSNISPTIQTYNTMISVYGRGRNLDKAVDMFNIAQSMGVALDEKIYTNMICTYGKAGKVCEASALFTRMQEEGIKPGLMSYNIMINAFAADGQYHEAEQILLSMQRDGCSPDSLTYLAIIRAYTKAEKYSESERVIKLMQEEGLCLSSAHFNLLLSGFTKEGFIEEADRVYKQIYTAGLKPDLESRRIMLRCFLDYGHVEEGIYFFERECCSINEDKFISSAAVHLYDSANNKRKAKEVLDSINASGAKFLDNLKVGARAKAVATYCPQ